MANVIDEVVLVDEDDRPVGVCEKMLAHRGALRHRAFSVYIFDAEDRLLLQQRSALKYHSSGLWTNTCCGHPRPGEETLAAARRRLREEMGMAVDLREVFQYTYSAAVSGGLVEHEVVHVFLGVSQDRPTPDPAEASDFTYRDCAEIQRALREEPARFTTWFALSFDRVLESKSTQVASEII